MPKPFPGVSPSSLSRRQILRPNLLFGDLWQAHTGCGRGWDPSQALLYPILAPLLLDALGFSVKFEEHFPAKAAGRDWAGGWSQEDAFVMGGIREMFGFILMPGLLQGLGA